MAKPRCAHHCLLSAARALLGTGRWRASLPMDGGPWRWAARTLAGMGRGGAVGRRRGAGTVAAAAIPRGCLHGDRHAAAACRGVCRGCRHDRVRAVAVMGAADLPGPHLVLALPLALAPAGPAALDLRPSGGCTVAVPDPASAGGLGVLPLGGSAAAPRPRAGCKGPRQGARDGGAGGGRRRVAGLEHGELPRADIAQQHPRRLRVAGTQVPGMASA